ncbi:Ubiquitin-conjugating enzyme subunit [Neophaeococcomyces mojaviensis]|uniref:Ubiquitin-conjugating enzyme subunit n=1 Tax=Neophaeococcomyces mojaviensis TaxID=3383035 RepID=A0ACC3A174_9EURO|nr:Ubiquitin-conjugating enzyme subunit [Knufia sp. JES_112]
MAQAVLMKEYKELSKEKWVTIDFDDEDVLKWDLALMVVNPDSAYTGGYFKCQMRFPKNYPFTPPDFRFSKPLWHPNIYPDGRICISILHAPGDDIMSGESAGERWSPAQRVESVLISILSLLDDPEINSPANVDASVMYRDDKNAFKKRVLEDVERSKKDIPEGFIMPTQESTKIVAPKVVNDDDFWADSDAENFDFDDDDMDNGSATDGFAGSDDEEIDDTEDDDTATVKKANDNDRLDSDMTQPDD